ncbi:MAG: 6-carboxytetrahydropterin synthase [Desulfobacterales bacterium]|jgi:6-pyruvoyltetrahydropterin/6-carboxytetrahydropterin synthase|nr:6-carboxytetrahydropterin synthase [Desulfobacterales bacterium]
MYTVAVQQELIARHYLIGGDFGPENRPHPHRYRVEARLSGRALDAHGFLVDIDALAAGLRRALSGFHDRSLNELPEFEGLNPSLEHLCRILWQALADGLPAPAASALEVRIWEGPQAWAAYTQPLP